MKKINVPTWTRIRETAIPIIIFFCVMFAVQRLVYPAFGMVFMCLALGIDFFYALAGFLLIAFVLVVTLVIHEVTDRIPKIRYISSYMVAMIVAYHVVSTFFLPVNSGIMFPVIQVFGCVYMCYVTVVALSRT